MKILPSLKAAERFSLLYQKKNMNVGLVVGAFDVLHMGHINLFRHAKKYADILIVGLDNDETLAITKGENRPINNYRRRSQFLSEIAIIDHVFKIDNIFKHGDKDSTICFHKLYKKIKPTHIFTHAVSDGLTKERKEMAQSLGIIFIPDKSKTVTHTSIILNQLEKEL